MGIIKSSSFNVGIVEIDVKMRDMYKRKYSVC